MAKRQRNVRTIGRMLPMGKPDTVPVKVRHRGKNGSVWVTESIPGVSVKPPDTRVEPEKRTKDFHHDTCLKKAGVSETFWRDGREWCQSCYKFRYGTNPWLEPDKWGKPHSSPAPRPMTIAERMQHGTAAVAGPDSRSNL